MDENPAPGFRKHPDHSVKIASCRHQVEIKAGTMSLARSGNALILTENRYAPVLYIPFEDIDFRYLEKSSHVTYCPFKGEASYWSIPSMGEAGENIIWAYEHPYDEVSIITRHGAFYTDRLEQTVS